MKAYIHIGMEKTGTTSLQAAMGRNRDRLAEAGFFYPTYDGNHAHRQLPLVAARFEDVVDLWAERNVLSTEEALIHRARMIERIASDVAEQHDKTFIFSSEHCHSRLLDAASVANLAAIIQPHFDDVKIVVYLRRQDGVVRSYHNTYLLGGGDKRNAWESNQSDEYLDPKLIVERWASVFGIENIIVKVWRDSNLYSTVGEFFETIGFLEKTFDDDRTNESVSLYARNILLSINAMSTNRSAAANIARSFVLKSLSAFPKSRPEKPEGFEFLDRTDAMRIAERYRDSNEWVRRRFFPDRASLFDDDFSQYPESIAVDVDTIDLCNSAAAAFYAAADEWILARTELAYYRGRAHLDAGLPEVAFEEFVEGLKADPRHGSLWHMLALANFALGRTEDAVLCARRAKEIEPENEAHSVIIARFEAPSIELSVSSRAHFPLQRGA